MATSAKMFIPLKLFVILLSTIIIGTSGMGKFYRAISTLPRADYGMAIGYWNNTISIFGGQDNPRSLVEYNIATDTMNDTDQYWMSISNDAFGSSTYFTQIGGYLYCIEEGGRTFLRFNLATKTYESNWQNVNFPKTVYDNACLASSNQYLFVVGGGSTGAGTRYKNLQMFSLSNYSFITGPETNTGRARFACAVHPNNNRLYAIGGLGACGSCSDNTIESIYIGNNTDITTESWTYNANNLLSETRSPVSVIWGNDIYVIGGYDFRIDSSYDNFLDVIQILNTLTGVVTYAESNLDFGIQSAATIRVGQNLYVFGGAVAVSGIIIQRTSNWQYCDLLGTRPPTTDPTYSPTKNPTEQTSTPTTSEPTISPTLMPSMPSYTPTTAMPSYTPTTNEPTTLQPLSIPTTSPTLFPTMLPTNNPSTNIPTTSTPTRSPNTLSPTTMFPTSSMPTTGTPTTALPTTSEPTTSQPTTFEPTTSEPTTFEPTTYAPTMTTEPTTIRPTLYPSSAPTTLQPTTPPVTLRPTTYPTLEPTMTTVLVDSTGTTHRVTKTTVDVVDGIDRLCKIFSIVVTIIASILIF